MSWPWVRQILRDSVGLAAERALPAYAAERFDRWFANRQSGTGILPVFPNRQDACPTRGKVLLWDDTFVRYHEPQIGKAAVRVLEAAGFEVVLPAGRKCCGRPAFSQGRLDVARDLGSHNLALLVQLEPEAPVLFLEPSCYSMFAEDYRELRLEGADAIRARCWLFEEFIEQLLMRESNALTFLPRTESVAIHAHCHTKALRNASFQASLANRLPGRQATLLPTGCCGMAGAFGMSAEKVVLSEQVAKPLLQQLEKLPPDTVVLASGTSCRQQVSQLSPRRPLHMAEWLADALA
jgi:Fe-S oxidoreductase